eukprot:scaffold33028_cov32-Tisochrysis_lutea.AAC.5
MFSAGALQRRKHAHRSECTSGPGEACAAQGINSRIFACTHNLRDRILILQTKRETKRLGILAEFAQHRDCHVKDLCEKFAQHMMSQRTP